jgi:predicted membrane chloride channel (bestrophin family)
MRVTKDMKRHWVARGVKFVVFAALFVFVFGFVVMSLWNWLMPALFGWHLITFWQAVGVLVLSKILFGGFRGSTGRHLYWRRRMMERWEQMTPEEREKFRQGMHGRCGPFGSAVEGPKA